MPQQKSVGLELSKNSPGIIALGIAFLVVGLFTVLIGVSTGPAAMPVLGIVLLVIGVVFVILQVAFWLDTS